MLQGEVHERQPWLVPTATNPNPVTASPAITAAPTLVIISSPDQANRNEQSVLLAGCVLKTLRKTLNTLGQATIKQVTDASVTPGAATRDTCKQVDILYSTNC